MFVFFFFVSGILAVEAFLQGTSALRPNWMCIPAHSIAHSTAQLHITIYVHLLLHCCVAVRVASVGKHSMASHINHHAQRAIQYCTHLPAQCSDKLYTDHRQSGEAQSQHAAASAALEAAQVEVTQLKALAAERQKRFVMLNGTFKKKEDGLRDRADAAEQQMAEAQAVAEAAKAEAANAVQVRLQSLVFAQCCVWLIRSRQTAWLCCIHQWLCQNAVAIAMLVNQTQLRMCLASQQPSSTTNKTGLVAEQCCMKYTSIKLNG